MKTFSIHFLRHWFYTSENKFSVLLTQERGHRSDPYVSSSGVFLLNWSIQLFMAPTETAWVYLWPITGRCFEWRKPITDSSSFDSNYSDFWLICLIYRGIGSRGGDWFPIKQRVPFNETDKSLLRSWAFLFIPNIKIFAGVLKWI